MNGRINKEYFVLQESTFSPAADPRFLFMSEHHHQALAQLLYGLVESGCFVLLTGEGGTGKTTVCRALLEQLPENVDVALLLAPPSSGEELLLALADELNIYINNRDASQHELFYVLTRRLLENYGQGRRTVVILDEAQDIPLDALEQLRLLTNIETNTDKLLHVFLVGRPELRELLMKPALVPIAQRITARYQLEPLSATEARTDVSHRQDATPSHQGFEQSRGPLHRESSTGRGLIFAIPRARPLVFAGRLAHVSGEQIYQMAHAWRSVLSGEPQPHNWKRYLLPVCAAGFLLIIALLFSFSEQAHSSSSSTAQERPQPERTNQ